MLSDYVRDASITDSEFVWLGDSAVATLGSTRFARTGNQHGDDVMDATDGEHPECVTFSRNLVHEIGVYGKQTSAYASNLAWFQTVTENVCYRDMLLM